MTSPQYSESPMSADELYLEHRNKINIRTDRLFGGLMAFQFLGGIITALWLNPYAYSGTTATVHPHVYAAVILGALISFPPIGLALFMPGQTVTRYVISVCQALSSGLLIHLSGGRIETHFHVFGSLAFLAFYRDWKILVPATLVTATDHLVRGIYFPESVFGVVIQSNWRWIEHAVWVLFEDVFLMWSCISMTQEMRNSAARTAEATRKNQVLEAIRDTALDCVIGMDHLGRVTDFNPAAELTFGYRHSEVIGKILADLIVPEKYREAHKRGLVKYMLTGHGPVLNNRIEITAVRADGTEFPVELAITAVRLDGPPFFIAYLRDITARKKFEEQAKQSEMLAMVASRTDNAVIMTDAQGRIEWVNEGFTRITGYELTEVLGRKPGSFLQGPATDQQTVARIREHLQRNEGFTAEIINYGKDNREYWIAMEVQPILDSDGSVRYFMAIESEITQRKEMEKQLTKSRERFELAVLGSSDGLWDWDIVTGEVYFSPAFHLQIGFTNGELEPTLQGFSSRVHPDDLHYLQQAIEDAHARRSDVYRVEFRLRHKDGHYIWILSRGVVLHNARGQAIRMAGSHTDITVQRNAADALRRAEEKYRSVFENSTLGIFQCTREGHYINANPAMARIYGYDSPEHLVNGLIDIGRQHYINPMRRGELVANLELDGSVSDFEAQIRRTDGELRWISKRAIVVRDENGKSLYYEGMVEDITEARAAKAALHDALQAADQARFAAENANAAKSQFLANMSHEIRTPLNGVIGISELMIRKGGLTEQQLRYASIIHSSGSSLLSLINDILDFSKIEAGKLELSPIDFNIRSTIEDVVEMLTPKANAKNLTLGWQVERSVPARLLGDPDRIRQNLVNLVTNAIKFTERGQVMIRVTAKNKATTEAHLQFTVEDSGLGIPKDRLDRLFKSFSQVDSSTTRKFGGTGLGLAIVKQLAALMGGEVGVESEPGVGSTFWFTAKLGVVATLDHEATKNRGMMAAIRGLRVLVVDDQPTMLEIIREQLLHWQVDVDVCETTDIAYEMLQVAASQNNPYRVALVDLVIPHCDTRKFLREVTNDLGISSTSFHLMTAIDTAAGDEIVKELGIGACLHKPIRHSTLFDLLVNSIAGELANQERDQSSPVSAQLQAHILLAEDNEVNQEVASNIVIDAGCTVEIVSNGAAALAACVDSNKHFDLVLMDCQMPEMDGFEATRRIRNACGKELPIIALTANAISGDRERCLQAGMNDYVTKPIDPDLLIETMRRHLLSSERQKNRSPAEDAGVIESEVASSLSESVKASEFPKKTVDPIDRESLLRRCRGKQELAGKLLTLFNDSIGKQLADLQSLLDKAEWEGFTRVAHTVKGVGANISAASVSEIATELERLGKSEDAEGSELALADLIREVQKCVNYIPVVLAPTN